MVCFLKPQKIKIPDILILTLFTFRVVAHMGYIGKTASPSVNSILLLLLFLLSDHFMFFSSDYHFSQCLIWVQYLKSGEQFQTNLETKQPIVSCQAVTNYLTHCRTYVYKQYVSRLYIPSSLLKQKWCTDMLKGSLGFHRRYLFSSHNTLSYSSNTKETWRGKPICYAVCFSIFAAV